MPPINVLLTGLPANRSVNIRIGDHRQSLPQAYLTNAIVSATGLSADAFYLCQAGALLHPYTPVTQPGQHTAFVHLFFRRALPGGKGGFGALLKGSSGTKKTTNFDSCRDLHGRRLRDVRREQSLRIALRQTPHQQTPHQQTASTQPPPPSPLKRKRIPSHPQPASKRKHLEHHLHRISDDVSNAVASGLRSLAASRPKPPPSTPIVQHVSTSQQSHTLPTPMNWMQAYDGISSDSDTDSSGITPCNPNQELAMITDVNPTSTPSSL